jgi:hypothetical protein
MGADDYKSEETDAAQLRADHIENIKITKGELEKYNVWLQFI